MEVAGPRGPMRLWFVGHYREVVDGERLVYTDSMSDERGDPPGPTDAGPPPDILP